jgi:hypothetical protein
MRESSCLLFWSLLTGRLPGVDDNGALSFECIGFGSQSVQSADATIGSGVDILCCGERHLCGVLFTIRACKARCLKMVIEMKFGRLLNCSSEFLRG